MPPFTCSGPNLKLHSSPHPIPPTPNPLARSPGFSCKGAVTPHPFTTTTIRSAWNAASVLTFSQPSSQIHLFKMQIRSWHPLLSPSLHPPRVSLHAQTKIQILCGVPLRLPSSAPFHPCPFFNHCSGPPSLHSSHTCFLSHQT